MSAESRSYIENKQQQLQNRKKKVYESYLEKSPKSQQIVNMEAAELSEIDKQLSRVEAALHLENECPACFLQQGKKTPLISAIANNHEKFDGWECEACGYYEETPNRS